MIFDKKQLFAILKRAIKTFCQTAAAMITVGVGVEDLNWVRIISVSLVAFVYSILTNIGGTPEGKVEGAMIFMDGEDGPVLNIKTTCTAEELMNKKTINVAVMDERDYSDIAQDYQEGI